MSPADLPPDVEARLLPCPFCGGPVEYAVETKSRVNHQGTADCPIAFQWLETEKWNRRSGLSTSSEDAAKDTARLDWLDANPWHLRPTTDAQGRWFDDITIGSDYSPNLRAAIDAARAEGGNDAR